MNELESTNSYIPQPSPVRQPGLFGTKIPSSLAFGIVILLFFMPFLDIKCNSMVLQKVSGMQLATGFKIKSPGSDNSLIGGFENMNDDEAKATAKIEKKDPNFLALAALGLGILSLVLCLMNAKTGGSGGMITGILGGVALIATMIDVKSKLNAELPGLQNKAGRNAVTGFDKLGDNIYIAIDFTPWFYIAIIAFFTGAFFCYKRMQETKV